MRTNELFRSAFAALPVRRARCDCGSKCLGVHCPLPGRCRRPARQHLYLVPPKSNLNPSRQSSHRGARCRIPLAAEGTASPYPQECEAGSGQRIGSASVLQSPTPPLDKPPCLPSSLPSSAPPPPSPPLSFQASMSRAATSPTCANVWLGSKDCSKASLVASPHPPHPSHNRQTACTPPYKTQSARPVPPPHGSDAVRQIADTTGTHRAGRRLRASGRPMRSRIQSTRFRMRGLESPSESSVTAYPKRSTMPRSLAVRSSEKRHGCASPCPRES